MTKVQAIKESIGHHERMQEFGKTQDRKEKIVNNYSFLNMFNQIGETLGCPDCALCRKYCCSDCPLAKIGERCTGRKSTYRILSGSRTWGTLVKNEDKMIKVLKSLL